MPLTFPAHQLPVLPLKLWRPAWFDATALCVGAAAPDLANPLGAWMQHQSHTAIGIAAWSVPFTLVACALLRWRGAAGIFAQLPDAGVFRLRSYRVLGRRRPRVGVTIVSALIGAISHVVVDGFTHTGRWGANWAHLNTVIANGPRGREVTIAKLLQFGGHTVGSVAALCLFAFIGHRRLLEAWYGAAAVEDARWVNVASRERFIFWAVALAPVACTIAACVVTGRILIFATILATVVGLLGAGCLTRVDVTSSH